MKLFACAYQALFSVAPFREALLSLKLSDHRLNSINPPSMQDYWRGNSPSGLQSLGEDFWQQKGIVATAEEREALEGKGVYIRLRRCSFAC
jgi:hypothetical protein